MNIVVWPSVLVYRNTMDMALLKIRYFFSRRFTFASQKCSFATQFGRCNALIDIASFRVSLACFVKTGRNFIIIYCLKATSAKLPTTRHYCAMKWHESSKYIFKDRLVSFPLLQLVQIRCHSISVTIRNWTVFNVINGAAFNDRCEKYGVFLFGEYNFANTVFTYIFEGLFSKLSHTTRASGSINSNMLPCNATQRGSFQRTFSLVYPLTLLRACFQNFRVQLVQVAA